MGNHDFLQTALIFLLAAVLVVPLAKRFKLGAVLGYLLAGVVIGPSALGLIHETERVSRISEFGVVLMLFVIGLELSPRRLWVMRRMVFGTGLAQVLSCGVVIGAIAVYGLGLSTHAAIIIGGALALSSTAFGLQILTERKEAGSAYGRQTFAILLFQDLAAIPLIAAVPLLGSAAGESASPELDSVVRVVGMILAVVVGGRYLLRPLFRTVAKARIPEVSTATALLVVMGVAWLMEIAGISVTLGAFLAGVLLADSEYRHELESNIEPFKGLLLGLFFVSVGMSVDLSLLLARPTLVLGIVVGLLVVKGLLLWPLGRTVGRLDASDALRLAVLMAGGGEFAFVLLDLAHGNGLLDTEQRNVLVLAISVSMAVTPLLVLGAAKALNVKPKKPSREYDTIGGEAPRVIIAGFGRVGQIVGRVLGAQRIPFVALEASVEQVENVRRFTTSALSLYFGDPARPEMLRAAQADKAEVFVLATDDPNANIRTARLVKRQYPHLKIIARARNRQHVFRLMDLGIDEPVRETFDSSLEMTSQVLELLGMDKAAANERVERFRDHDERVLRQQYLVYDDEKALLQTSREALVDLEQLFVTDKQHAKHAGGDGGDGGKVDKGDKPAT